VKDVTSETELYDLQGIFIPWSVPTPGKKSKAIFVTNSTSRQTQETCT